MPKVISRRAQLKTKRFQAPYDRQNCFEGDRNIAVEEVSTQGVESSQGIPKTMQEFEAPATSEQSIEELNEELALLANLARKYGYKIVQSANEVSDDACVHEPSCHNEASSQEQRIDVNKNGSHNSREVCQEQMKRNNSEQQR